MSQLQRVMLMQELGICAGDVPVLQERFMALRQLRERVAHAFVLHLKSGPVAPQRRAFAAYAAVGQACTVGSPIYRFYSPRFQTHFFTISEQEKANTRQDANWSFEGVSYCADTTAQPGTLPRYRFWSPGFGKHFFTANEGEANQLRTSDPNWTYEGIAYFVHP